MHTLSINMSGYELEFREPEWNRSGAEALWKSLPPVYRQCAVCYTDFWSAYEQVLPQNRHRAVAKESGNWNFIHYYNAEIAPKLAITTY